MLFQKNKVKGGRKKKKKLRISPPKKIKKEKRREKQVLDNKNLEKINKEIKVFYS